MEQETPIEKAIDRILGTGAVLLWIDSKINENESPRYSTSRQFYDGLRAFIHVNHQADDPGNSPENIIELWMRQWLKLHRCWSDYHFIGAKDCSHEIRETFPSGYIYTLGHVERKKSSTSAELMTVLKELLQNNEESEKADLFFEQYICYAILSLLRAERFFAGGKTPEESVYRNLLAIEKQLRKRIAEFKESAIPEGLFELYTQIAKKYLELHKRAELTTESIWQVLDNCEGEGKYLKSALGAALIFTKVRNNYEGFIDNELLKKLNGSNITHWRAARHLAAFIGTYEGLSRLPDQWRWKSLFEAESEWIVPLCTYMIAVQNPTESVVQLRSHVFKSICIPMGKFS